MTLQERAYTVDPFSPRSSHKGSASGCSSPLGPAEVPMDLIDAFILLGSDRKLLLAVLFLLITAFGLFVATLYLTRENAFWRGFFGRSLPFHWKRVAVILSLTSLGLLLLAVLLLKNALGPTEKPEEGAWEQLESIDIPELQEEMRRGRKANGSSSE